MFSFQTNDDASQLKHFILSYYRPVLDQIDIDQMTEGTGTHKGGLKNKDSLKPEQKKSAALAEPKQ